MRANHLICPELSVYKAVFYRVETNKTVMMNKTKLTQTVLLNNLCFTFKHLFALIRCGAHITHAYIHTYMHTPTQRRTISPYNVGSMISTLQIVWRLFLYTRYFRLLILLPFNVTNVVNPRGAHWFIRCRSAINTNQSLCKDSRVLPLGWLPLRDSTEL